MFYYKGNFAETEIKYAFRHAETAGFFGDYLTTCLGKEDSACEEIRCDDTVQVPFADLRYWDEKWGFPESPSSEFGLSVFHTCNHLLKKKRVVFHAAAFMWQGKSYLLTAPSGTGKTTQLKNLLSLYGNDVHILNGDKPILRVLESGDILVCPSPWKGKERWGDDKTYAILAGIIVLEQAKENVLRKLTIREAIPLLLQRFLFIADSREVVLAAASVEEAILKTVPVWHFKNSGDLASTRLLGKTVLQDKEHVHAL